MDSRAENIHRCGEHCLRLFVKGIAKGEGVARNHKKKGGASVCLRSCAFDLVCLLSLAFAPLCLIAFVNVVLHLFAF